MKKTLVAKINLPSVKLRLWLQRLGKLSITLNILLLFKEVLVIFCHPYATYTRYRRRSCFQPYA